VDIDICCTYRLSAVTRPAHTDFDAIRLIVGRAKSVIRLGTRAPILAWVFWFSKVRVFSFGPTTTFKRPMCVSRGSKVSL
jgi:hypothetical protein